MGLTYNNLTIILIFLIIIFYIYTKVSEGIRNTTYFDNDANYQYIMEEKPCVTYNCPHGSKIEDQLLLVGNDSEKNVIFKYNNSLYKLENDTLILSDTDSKQLEYFENPIMVPFNLSTMKLKIKLEYNGYKYIGLLNNNFYNQEYILYEKPYDKDKELEDKLFYYILVKIIENKYTIMYELPPRNKILPNEHIWASYGAFQIGPLIKN
jgi:hypothetical protein